MSCAELILLRDRSSNSIQISLALLCDFSTTVLSLFENSELLERLYNLALYGTGAISVVRRPVSTVDGSSV